jgi:hypothetical protein
MDKNTAKSNEPNPITLPAHVIRDQILEEKLARQKRWDKDVYIATKQEQIEKFLQDHRDTNGGWVRIKDVLAFLELVE